VLRVETEAVRAAEAELRSVATPSTTPPARAGSSPEADRLARLAKALNGAAREAEALSLPDAGPGGTSELLVLIRLAGEKAGALATVAGDPRGQAESKLSAAGLRLAEAQSALRSTLGRLRVLEAQPVAEARGAPRATPASVAGTSGGP